MSGEGIAELKEWLIANARTQVPSTQQPGVNAREATLLEDCCGAAKRAQGLYDPVLIAEELRTARTMLDRVSGVSGVEQLLDALFGRFCLGK